MKTYRLVKNNVTIFIRIGKADADLKKSVDGNADTSMVSLTPLAANRQVNDLIRRGYTLEK